MTYPPQPARSGQNVLTLKNMSQSYDGKTWVYEDLNLTLERGQKIALVGPNGSGKSTLIKLLAGAIPYQEGERKLGHNVRAGYFSQHRTEMFRSGKTVLEEALNTERHHSEQTVRTLLGSFLFRGDAVFKKVEVLSGGEKSRLGLARLLLDHGDRTARHAGRTLWLEQVVVRDVKKPRGVRQSQPASKSSTRSGRTAWRSCANDALSSP